MTAAQLGSTGPQNVLARLLGIRGGQTPDGLARTLQPFWDVSRRDPEMLFDLGFVPWSCQAVQGGVAAQFSTVQVTVQAGVIVVLWWAESQNGTAVGVMSLWDTALLQAPIAVQNIWCPDSRIGTDIIAPGFQINAATVVALPAAEAGMELHAYTTEAPQGRAPVVIGGPSIGPARTFRLLKRTGNSIFMPTLWGYVLPAR